MRKSLFIAVLFIAACSDSPVQNQNDSSRLDSMVVMTDTTLPKPASNILDTVLNKEHSLYSMMDPRAISDAMIQNTPSGWEIMDTMTGDLNRDQFLDMLIVLQSTAKFVPGDEVRPLLVLIGAPDGGLYLAEQNDHVVLCQDCGGVYGDPYDGLAIKNGYFSVEHYGGSSWRWTKIITFRYNEVQKTWLLHRDAGVSYSVFEPEKEEEIIDNKEHYGKMKFLEYNSL